jgi:putative PIN family toxin of toxin-antitoxin system
MRCAPSAALAASVSVRVVLDTNVVDSGLLWKNTPRQLLDAVRDGRLTAFTSLAMLDELTDVLGRDHLAALIARLASTPADLVYGYSKLARLATVATVPRAVLADPDDDQVLACALAARAQFVITGDRKHLLPMKSYRGISIVSPREALDRAATE